MGQRLSLAPSVRNRAMKRVNGLGLNTSELRLVNSAIDGARSAQDIVDHGGIPARTVLLVLLTLTLFDCLEWTEATVDDESKYREKIETLAKEKELGNHFDALEVHWSAELPEIHESYERIMKKLQRGTPAFKAAPEACRQMEARIQIAYDELSNPHLRIRHQRQYSKNLDVKGMNDLMMGTIDSMEIRGERTRARKTRDKLEALNKNLGDN